MQQFIEIKNSVKRANKYSFIGTFFWILTLLFAIAFTTYWSIQFHYKEEKEPDWTTLIILSVILGVFGIISMVFKIYISLDIYSINRFLNDLNNEKDMDLLKEEKTFAWIFWFLIASMLFVPFVDLYARLKIFKLNKKLNYKN